MTAERGGDASPLERVRWPGSWLLLAAVCVVALLSALYVAFTPAGDQTTLSGRTFAEFAAGDPEIAARFSLQLVLVGVVDAAFSLLALTVALVPYRRGERWAWFALWLLPVAFGLVTVRMLADEYEVGYYYLILTIAAALGLLLPGTRFLRQGGRGLGTAAAGDADG